MGKKKGNGSLIIVMEKKYNYNFKDGESDGLQTDWYENGQKEYEETYKDGESISEKRWNKDGSVDE